MNEWLEGVKYGFHNPGEVFRYEGARLVEATRRLNWFEWQMVQATPTEQPGWDLQHAADLARVQSGRDS